MTKWKLVDIETGAEVKFGDLRKTFRDESVTVTGFQPPHKPESTGKVFVNYKDDGGPAQFYPSVIGCRYEEQS